MSLSFAGNFHKAFRTNNKDVNINANAAGKKYVEAERMLKELGFALWLEARRVRDSDEVEGK